MSTIMGSAFASHRRLFHISLWTVQMLLACFFVVTGSIRLGIPSERLVESMMWAGDVPVAVVRLVGLCELLGAFALVLPTAMHARERIAGVVATGFVALNLALALLNGLTGELRVLPLNLVLAALAAFVAWGRGLHDEFATGMSARPG